MVGLVFLLQISRPATIAEFDGWAKSRDVAAVEGHADAALKGKFAFLKNTGAFGVGEKGWRAEELADPVGNRRFVVFTSALTTQDYGDQVFEWRDGVLTELVHEKETRGVNLTAAHLDIRFNIPEKRADIFAKISLVAQGAKDGSFFVRLGDNYKVDQVTDLKGNLVKFGQAGGVLSLPVANSGEFEYRVHYSGVVNRPRFAGAIVDEEVMLTNDYWWPHIGRLPLALSTTTHVPKDWVVIGQGDKIYEQVNGDLKSVAYVNKVPVSYMSLSAGKFLERERTVNGIRYFVASRELTAEQMDDQLEFVPPVIEFFSKLFPHPYKEYGAVDTKLYGGGALEAYSYATYGTGWLPAEDAHEPSHTWWGGVIPNTYLDSFWNESFAVFSEGFYAREGSIGDVTEKRKAFVTAANASGVYNMGTPFSTGAESGGIASAMGYGKGGDILEQLEFEMGTQKMSATLKKWLSSHQVGEAGGWPEFEAACGPEWKWFFDQWIRRTGWPKLTLGEYEVSGSEGAIELSQEAPFYRFKLEYAVEGAEGWRYGSVNVVPDSSGKSVVKIPVEGNWKVISLDPFDRLLQPRRPMEAIRFGEGSRRMTTFDPKNIVEGRNEIDDLPEGLSNVLMVGTPSEVPESAKYWSAAGFEFAGNVVSYKGVSVDLDRGAAVAIVEYEPGKFLGLRAGKTKYAPNVGIANAALVDQMGRFLTGTTIPRTNGPLIRRPL